MGNEDGGLDKKLQFPDAVETNLRQDMVVWWTQVLIAIKGTVPWDERCGEAHQRNADKYAELMDECRKIGWITWLFPLEVEYRGVSCYTNVEGIHSTWNYSTWQKEGNSGCEQCCWEGIKLLFAQKKPPKLELATNRQWLITTVESPGCKRGENTRTQHVGRLGWSAKTVFFTTTCYHFKIISQSY